MAEIPFEPYTGQSKLRFWCQKVLPLVYDDSLSYYELLGKVVEYLNNTIADVSACEDNITALRDAFVQLQNYVNEQLEDFAPEVERIIDEMIDSGEFGEILADTVNGLIANEYTTTQGYAQFDYVIKDGKLYCATVSTSGEWDATKWRETTVGADMQLLNQRVYNLNAGQVAFNESATYDNGTVGKKLKDLDDFDDNLNAGQVAYNSEGAYNNATVGKELQELKGSINAITPLDSTPTNGSTKGITSGAVYTAEHTVTTITVSRGNDIIAGTNLSQNDCRKFQKAVIYNAQLESKTSSEVTYPHNTVLFTGLPRPHQNIIFMAYTFLDNKSDQHQYRLMLTTDGDIKVYWDTVHIPKSGSSFIVYITYFTSD